MNRFVVAIALTLASCNPASAQRIERISQQVQPAQPAQVVQPVQPAQPPAERNVGRNSRPFGALYRIDLTMTESEGATRLNARTYMTMARIDGEPALIRVGSRLPVTADASAPPTPASLSKGVQYIDVGLNIDVSQLGETDGKIVGSLSVEMSSVAPLEAGQAPTSSPVLRNLRLRTPFAVVHGKPAIVGTLDDVNSKRRFQVEVTATKQ